MSVYGVQEFLTSQKITIWLMEAVILNQLTAAKKKVYKAKTTNRYTIQIEM